MTTNVVREPLIEAANLLLDARRTNTPIHDLSPELQPATQEEAYLVQDLMAIAYGEIGGWKVGAPTPEATPIFAPMPLNWIAPSGSSLTGHAYRYRGIEAEIAFLFDKDLPPRTTPYSLEEIVAVIASCHPAIEILETCLVEPTAAKRLSMSADFQIHGGFVYGPAYSNWKSLDFATEDVSLIIDGVVRVERTGSNTSGDLMRLLPWLANEGATRTGGIKAGQWVTTGSWTGNEHATSISSVEAIFAHAGRVSLRFV